MPAGKGRVGRGSHEEERGQEGGHAGEPGMGRRPHRRGQGWGGGQAGSIFQVPEEGRQGPELWWESGHLG